MGIGGSVEQRHWAAFRHPEQRRLLTSDRVKDGLNIVHTLLKREISGAREGLRQNGELIHAFDSEVADILAQVAVGDQVPRAVDMYQPIRVGCAGALGAGARLPGGR